MNNQLTFKDLGLSDQVLESVQKKGFEEPSEIQALTIPAMLQNTHDIIAQAQTGTGKTAAFALPLIDLISEQEHEVQSLILTPTRELAIQVCEEILSLKGASQLKVIPVYGGQSIDQQLRRLKKGAHIVVGTPGRVIDHIKRKTLKLGDIRFLVLDEADEMLNMGFVEDMEEIMKHTSPDKRTLMFSATMPKRISDLASGYMKEHEIIAVKKQQLTTTLTEQIYYEVRAADKFEALCRIIDIEEDFYGVVFCRTKSDVDTVASHLVDRGYDADAIHGDITQAQREKTLGQFRKKKTNVLVATDVAARGIDINNLTHVINYSLPQDPESYVHRIGRTGRAGKQGTAITFITPSEYQKLMTIQRIAKTDIKRSKIPNVSDVIKLKKTKIQDDIDTFENIDEKYYNWAKRLLEKETPAEVVAKLLQYSFEKDLDPSMYNEIKELSGSRKNIELQGKTRLFIALGKKDDFTPQKLISYIIKNAGVQKNNIRKVDVFDNFSFVTVPFNDAETILKVFKKKKRNKRPLVSKARSK